MFLRMIRGAFARQWKKMLIIALTIMLGTSLATAMINVMLDVGDKVNQELKTYGANITVLPKSASVMSDLYEMEGDTADTGSYLLESEIGNVKTIFWAFNIVDFAPFIDTQVSLESGSEVKLKGTWFNHHLDLPTGESLDAGVNSLRSWWDLDEGEWINEQDADKDENVAMVGTVLAKREGISVGDVIHVEGPAEDADLTVTGIFDAGGDEDEEIFAPLDLVQKVSNTDGYISSIEVSALTTPDNELAEKAAKDPGSLTIAQYELWYCTAYVSSICYQIQEAITDSVASPVRQVADSEGAIMDKTELLMILITKDSSISGLVLTEILLTGVAGAVAGYFLGFGFAQIIGHTVFNSSIEMKPFVIPVVAVLMLAVTLIGSIPAIRMLLRLDPAEVLHGR